MSVFSLLASPLWAHDQPDVIDARFSCAVADVAGTLLVPHLEPGQKVPCVVILGGSLSDTRDGEMHRTGAPPRDALKRLAGTLLFGGYASLRYDKVYVGRGSSRPKEGWNGSYTQEAEVAAAAIRYVRGRPEVSQVIVIGESAGAYLACLAAKAGTQADLYVFLGALCSPPQDLYEYNFGRLVKYVESDPERLAWAEQNNLRNPLALGRRYREMFTAAAEGKEANFLLVDGDFRAPAGLARRREELAMRPDEMFRHIQKPALALAGERDLNVPPEHAARAAEIMREAGNQHAASLLIAGADHSFQQTPADADLRFRQRHTLASFGNAYEPKLYLELLAWLHVNAPTTAEGTTKLAENASQAAKGESTNAPAKRAVAATEIDPVTETTPRRVQLAPGIEIVDDITDLKQTAGVPTLEGRIGPLLLAEGCQAHFIDMPAGMYVEEHPHSTESIIYTVRGRWVLCSAGRRQVMKPGTLFRFAANTPTGYEIPFAEDAYILIFKGDRTTKVEKDFIDYLRGMAGRLVEEQKKGVPFLLKDLPAEHAARKFAREVNPEFERTLPKN